MSISPRVPAGIDVRPVRQTGPHVLVRQIFFVLVSMEVGVVLLLLPWTLLWDNNYFFSLQPEYSAFWLGNHLRGAVSGIGLVNLWLFGSELIRLIGQRRG